MLCRINTWNSLVFVLLLLTVPFERCYSHRHVSGCIDCRSPRSNSNRYNTQPMITRRSTLRRLRKNWRHCSKTCSRIRPPPHGHDMRSTEVRLPTLSVLLLRLQCWFDWLRFTQNVWTWCKMTGKRNKADVIDMLAKLDATRGAVANEDENYAPSPSRESEMSFHL